MGAWERQMDQWDRDWGGASFNGRCLREELAAHSAAEAASDRNAEGYTVWGVALHVHKYKAQFLAVLEGRDPDWFAGEDDFPPVPEGGLSEKHWIEVQHRMNDTHEALVAKARTLDEAFLATVYPVWQISWGDAFAWATGHDGYHTAQIRNMKR